MDRIFSIMILQQQTNKAANISLFSLISKAGFSFPQSLALLTLRNFNLGSRTEKGSIKKQNLREEKMKKGR
jgi:hypothetical protein